MHPLRVGPPIRLYTLFAIAAVAAVLPFARVLGDLYNIWNLKPEYSHGVIIPVISAFLIWRQREELRRQIAPCEVVIVVPSAYRAAADLVLFQLNFAKAADRPIVAMENFGSTAPLAKAIQELADEVSAWNERSLIDALKRQARHQESTRWDSIDFKLD